MGKKIVSIKTIAPGSPPDIDTDFGDHIRDDVMATIIDKYGAGNVARIGTYGTYKAKGSLKVSASIYSIPIATAKRVQDVLPPDGSNVISGYLNEKSEIYSEGAQFRDMVSNEDTWGEVVECAKGIEGRISSSGMHACGLIISSKPLKNIVPLNERVIDGTKWATTQWEYPQLEAMGLIKMDMLGLSTVTLICKIVEHCVKSGVDSDRINMEKFVANGLQDEETYKMFAQGQTDGIFQFGNKNVQEVCRHVVPTELKEIADITALYRPGPMEADAHNDYWRHKHGVKKVVLPHQDFVGTVVEDIYNSTNGVLIYQEQVMDIAVRGAGMTLKEADTLRKAMGKKKIKVMEKMSAVFIQGGMKKMNVSEEAMKALWNVIVPFSGYGFNKSHAISYAMLSVQVAYLKRHFPREFVAATLDMRYGDAEKARAAMIDARAIGVHVKPVDINKSYSLFAPDYSTDAQDVFFGFNGISGVTGTVADVIVAEREAGGLFTSVENFLERMFQRDDNKLRKNNIIALADAGAFDSLGVSRKSVVKNIDEWIKTNNKKERAKQKMSNSFGLFAMEDVETSQSLFTGDEYPFMEMVKREADVSSLYLSHHPLEKIADTKLGKIQSQWGAKQGFTAVAAVYAVTEMKSGKYGSRWSVTLDDGKGYFDVPFKKEFNSAFQTYVARQDVKKWFLNNHTRKLNESVVQRAQQQLSIPPMKTGEVYKVSFRSYGYGDKRRYYVDDFWPVLLDVSGRELEPVFVPLWKTPTMTKENVVKMLSSMGDSDSTKPLVALVAHNYWDIIDLPEFYAKAVELGSSSHEKGKWEDVCHLPAFDERMYYESLLRQPYQCDFVPVDVMCNSSAEAYSSGKMNKKARAFFERNYFMGDDVNFGIKFPRLTDRNR